MNDDLSRRELLEGVRTGRASQSGAPVDGWYTVGLKRSAGPAAADEVAGRAEAVDRRIDLGDHGVVVSGRFPEPARAALTNDPRVSYVEPEVETRGLQTEPYGVRQVNADTLRQEGRTGAGVTVGVLDTGVDDDHPDLPTPVRGRSFVANCGNDDCYNNNPCNYTWSDDEDHGTHVAGTIAATNDSEGVVGVAPGADLLAGKVLNGCFTGTGAALADGIVWATDQGADVINMSLGAPSGSSTIENACQYAVDRDVVLVAAAGNDGPCTDCVKFPAAYSTVIAVSATDDEDTLTNFSSTGPEVELAAPGQFVYSTVPPESDADDDGTTESFAYFSGTSMAAPHVAATAAILSAETSLSGAEIRDRLSATARDVGLGSNEQGNGRLDASNAVLLFDDRPYSQPARFQFAAPALDDTRVYVGGLDGTVRAITRADGGVAWSRSLSGSLVDSSPARSGDGSRLYVGSGSGGLYALATGDGSVVWQYGTDSAVVSSPTVADGTVYVGTNDGRVLALDDGSTATETWSLTVGSPVLSTPAVDTDSGTVVVTTNDGDVVGVDTTTGAETWRVATGTELGHASPEVAGGSVYVAADDAYRIDAATGGVVWRQGPYGGFSESTPAYADSRNDVFVGRADGKVYALNRDAGGVDDSFDTDASTAYTPVIVGDRVAVAGGDGRLRLLDIGNGERYADRGVGSVRSRPVVDPTGDAAFVTTWDGSLVRLNNV